MSEREQRAAAPGAIEQTGEWTECTHGISLAMRCEKCEQGATPVQECCDPSAPVVACCICGSPVHTCERRDDGVAHTDYRCPMHPEGVQLTDGRWTCSDACFERAAESSEAVQECGYRKALEDIKQYFEWLLTVNRGAGAYEVGWVDAIKALGQYIEGKASAPCGCEQQEFHGKPCYFCGEPVSSFAADPGRWGIPLCHEDEPGKVKPHHIGCVAARLAECKLLKSQIKTLEIVIASQSRLIEARKGIETWALEQPDLQAGGTPLEGIKGLVERLAKRWQDWASVALDLYEAQGNQEWDEACEHFREMNRSAACRMIPHSLRDSGGL